MAIMDKATKAIRRGSVRLRSSLSPGNHGDLHMIISELRDLRHAAKTLIASQQSTCEEMVRWSSTEDNRALQDCMKHIAELNAMWIETQKAYIDELKSFRSCWESILEGEMQVDRAQNNLVACEQREMKVLKEIKKTSKRGTEEDLSELGQKLSQIEQAKENAQVEVAQTISLSEGLKVARLKDSLLSLSDVCLTMANKLVLISQAQKDVVLQLPDVMGQELQDIQYSGAHVAQEVIEQTKERLHNLPNHFSRTLQNGVGEEPPPPYSAAISGPSCPIYEEFSGATSANPSH